MISGVMWRRILLGGVAVILLAPTLLLAVLSLLSRRPDNLGLGPNGRLAPCPSTPNCVSTQATRKEQQIAPLSFQGSAEDALQRLRSTLEGMPRIRIVTEKRPYLHAEATSLLFRFVDDLEFLVDAENQQIHFRSASRVGRSDLGANRARAEAIRQKFQEQASNAR